MAFIGNTVQTVPFITDTFSGTGAQTAFTLTRAPAGSASIAVFIAGVYQAPSAYTLSGVTITFVSAPTAGAGNIIVLHLGNGSAVQVPSDGSVTISKLSSDVYGYINAAFATANSDSGVANSGAIYANSGFAVANSAASYANSAFLRANTPSATANSAASYANSAFSSANTSIITGDRIGLNAINANNIVNASITGDKIGVGQITSNLFAAGAISTSNISSGNSNVSVTSANGNVTIGTAGSERMRIDSAGNVGIGTTSPTQKITLNGNLLVTGGAYAIGLSSNFYAGIVGDSSGDNLYYKSYQNHIWKTTTDSGANSTGTERMRIDSSGNLLFNSGYGSVATAYGCRAWVNFNGTGTVAIRGSGNVSSITDNGTGDYTINYTTAMPDGNYSIVGFTRSDNNDNPAANFSMGSSYSPETGSARIMTGVSNSKIDFGVICAAVFR